MKVVFLYLLLALSLEAKNMGALLFNGNCVTCHHETESISAPSILEIKQHYLRSFPLKKDFIAYMSSWVLQPKEETSIMLDAIKQYDLMPSLAYERSTLEEITEYIYENQFGKK